MNLVIVEDSYLNVKYKGSYSWLTGEEDEDENNGEETHYVPQNPFPQSQSSIQPTQ